MTNGTKIIIGLIIVILVVISIVVIVNKLQNVEPKEENDIFNSIIEENNNLNEIENKELNEITNTQKNNTTTNTQLQTNTSTTVVGKEEQESKQENVEEQNKQKAIKLAKEEWAISVDSYNFDEVIKEGENYKVTVRNKTDRKAVAIYIVNVSTGTVTEQ